MKKVLLLAIALMLFTTGCSREVYVSNEREIIKERERTSDVIIIDREKEVYKKEKIKPLPSSDSGFQTVID